MASKSLNAGFTGDIDENQRLPARAKTALSNARDEAGLVAAHAVDHPAATGSMVAAAGILGLAVGYFLGSASRQGNWR